MLSVILKVFYSLLLSPIIQLWYKHNLHLCNLSHQCRRQIFNDNDFAWSLLEAEVQLETSDAVSPDDVSYLLQLYMVDLILCRKESKKWTLFLITAKLTSNKK